MLFKLPPLLGSPHLHNRLQCLLLILLGIDFRNHRGAVAQYYPRRFQPELLTQERGGVVRNSRSNNPEIFN